MSPMLAYRRRVPPSTLMHNTSRAPELSATLSRDSCWITGAPSSSPLEHFDDAPALQLRHRARFAHADPVPFAHVVGLVVGVEVLRALDRLLIAAVPDPVDDRDDNRLVHLDLDRDALTDLAAVRSGLRGVVGHYVSSRIASCAAISRSRRKVCSRAMSRRTTVSRVVSSSWPVA